MFDEIWLREVGIDLLARPTLLTAAIHHELQAAFEVSPHHHRAELQLDLIRGCRGRVFRRGRWLRFESDLLLVAYPGMVHGYSLEPARSGAMVQLFRLSASARWQLVERELLPQFSRAEASEQRAQGVGPVRSPDVFELASMAIGGIGDLASPRAASLLNVLMLLEAWPRRAMPADLTADAGPAEQADVEAAVSLIEERLHDPPDAVEIAAEVGVSARHLSRLFLRSLGVTPHRYATLRRLDRARVLLLSKRGAVSEVGEELGFSSHATFTRWFRQHTGITPQEYRTSPSVF